MVPIQLFVPTFDVEACLTEVRDCLERGWTGLGFKTLVFEAAWSRHTGHAHTHFLNSATSALQLALNVFKHARGWADGDEVISTSLTFVSTNHAILHERLSPVFADVDRHLCLDPDEIERHVTPRTRAVLFVGLAGSTGQLPAIRRLCQAHGLVLILDAAHMAGTRLDGEAPAADAVCYSFQAVKNLPTADAGAICFQDPTLDAVARKMAWLGIDKDTFERSGGVATGPDAGTGRPRATYAWEYAVEHVGFKYHGNAIMAGIALAQLPHLEAGNVRRREICAAYEAGFDDNPAVATVPQPPGCISSRHLFQILVPDRDGLIDWLNAAEIFPGVHYRDNTGYPMFAAQRDRVPRARAAARRVLSLPLHLRLDDADVRRVVDAVNTYPGRAGTGAAEGEPLGAPGPLLDEPAA